MTPAKDKAIRFSGKMYFLTKHYHGLQVPFLTSEDY